jgi:phosphohistidine phosphatase SixA
VLVGWVGHGAKQQRPGTGKAAMVYLLRHAHAGSQKRWPGPDHDRPLSLRGKEQAIGLLVTLRDEPVTRILASPAVRCRHTVLPLSHHRGVPIELASSLAVQAPVERLLELVLDPGMEAAVL